MTPSCSNSRSAREGPTKPRIGPSRKHHARYHLYSSLEQQWAYYARYIDFMLREPTASSARSTGFLRPTVQRRRSPYGRERRRPLPRDTPTLRSEPMLAEQPPREIKHEHALPGVGLIPRAGDEDLRERVPDGQERRKLPLERRFGVHIISRIHSPSRFRNSRSFIVSKPRGQYAYGCVEGRSRSRHVGSDGRLAYGTSDNPQTHIIQEGYVAKVAKKVGISESEVPRLMRNIIRDGRIVSNEIRKTNGRKDYDRICECNDERILLTGIGLNGLMVSANH